MLFTNLADQLTANLSASARHLRLVSSTAPAAYVSISAITLKAEAALQEADGSTSLPPLLAISTASAEVLGVRVDVAPAEMFGWTRTLVRQVVMSFTRPRHKSVPRFASSNSTLVRPSGPPPVRVSIAAASFLLQSNTATVYDAASVPLLQLALGDVTGKLLRDDSAPAEPSYSVFFRVDGVRADLQQHRSATPAPDLNNRISGNVFSLLDVSADAELDRTYACRRASIDLKSLFFEVNFQLLDTLFGFVADIRVRVQELLVDTRRLRAMRPELSSPSIKLSRGFARPLPVDASSTPLRVPFPVNLLLHDLRLVLANDLADNTPEAPLLFVDVGVVAVQARADQKLLLQVHTIDVSHVGEVERVVYRTPAMIDTVPFAHVGDILVEADIAQLPQQTLPVLVTVDAVVVTWQLGLHISIVQV